MEENTPNTAQHRRFKCRSVECHSCGMKEMVDNSSVFDDMTNFSMAGKTGTAEESTDHPNHGLFIGYALGTQINRRSPLQYEL